MERQTDKQTCAHARTHARIHIHIEFIELLRIKRLFPERRDSKLGLHGLGKVTEFNDHLFSQYSKRLVGTK